MKDYQFYPEGDGALLIVFGKEISPEINRKVMLAERRIRRAGIPGVLDLIPAFASLLVQYDPVRISWEKSGTGWKRPWRPAGKRSRKGSAG